MKRLLLIMSSTILSGIFTVNAQSIGYVYVHKKALSEGASVDFSFSLTGSSGYENEFILNDQPDARNIYDLGASHGDGVGQLWAVASDVVFDGSHVVTGTIYYRNANTSNWIETSIDDARTIDGIDENSAVYSNESGNVFIYEDGTNTQIWNVSNHSGINIIDVASGGEDGIIVAVGENGRLYKYTGNGTTDNWQVFENIVPTTALVDYVRRVDVHPTTQNIVFQQDNTTVGTVSSANPATAMPTILDFPTEGIVPDPLYPNRFDVCYADNGTINAVLHNDERDGNFVFDYDGSSWTFNIQARGLAILTGGMGDQVWGVNNVNWDVIRHSIFTKTHNRVWIDDERVRTSDDGNSIIIPIEAGTYTLTEDELTDWSNSKIFIYDPSNNSTANVTTSTTTLNVSAGEVVHVVYENTLKNSISVPTNCEPNLIVTFGSGADEFGPELEGYTAYHHYANGSVSDGYYTLVKNTDGWFSSAGATDLTNHTGDDDGYFAIFNSSYTMDEFFRRTITDLVPGEQYQMSFWAADISPDPLLRPNIKFGVADAETGVELGYVVTGDITATEWQIFVFNFTAVTNTAEIFIRNNSVGGGGNDLGLDDIEIRVSPTEIANIEGPGSICSANIPDGTTYIFTNSETGGTGVWSSNDTTIVKIDPSTGVATPVADATGSVTITYEYTNELGCVSYAFLDANVAPCVSTAISISGNVFNDMNGMKDGHVNGEGTNADGLNVIVYDNTTGEIIAVVPVDTDGSYNVEDLPNGHDYSIVLSTETPTTGPTTIPSSSLPENWYSTGEKVGTTSGTDATINGILKLGTINADVTNINFGINEAPTAIDDEEDSQTNPGGTESVIVDNSLFSGTDPNSGNIENLRITTFPSNVTSITINGVNYIESNFPDNGVLIPTDNNGNPLIPITIDPIDGEVNVEIEYTVIDNAGLESPEVATVNIPFHTLTISGSVLRDGDAGNVNGTESTNTVPEGLFANLLDEDGNVLLTVPVNEDGGYMFEGVQVGDYTVRLSTNENPTNASDIVYELPDGWESTGAFNGEPNTGNTGDVTGTSESISVTDESIENVNFGVQMLPEADPKMYVLTDNPTTGTIFNLGDGGDLSEGHIPGALTGSDPEDGTFNTTSGEPYTVIINEIASNGVLMYDGVPVTEGQEIPNYNPSLLTIELTGEGYTTVTFYYSVVDGAGAVSEPVEYSIFWEVPLSVDLLEFLVNKVQNNVVLTWHTATEHNNKGFYIEHSANAQDWKVLDFISSKGENGNSINVLSYQFTHINPVNGINYYRLNQVDLDGRQSYSMTRSITFGSQDSYNIFPNPATEKVTIQNLLGNEKIYIFNAIGQLVLETTANEAELNLSIQRFSAGNYTLQIVNSSNQAIQYKLVIAK